MNINTKSSDIRNAVLSSLANNTKLFMLRMGDGEMRLERNMAVDHFSRKEFGRHISEDERTVATKWMRESVLESSILGLPTREHVETSPMWTYLFEYYAIIRREHPDQWIEKVYCSINSHYELFGSGDLFEIFSKVEKIVIVSPRDVVQRMKEKFPNIKEVEYYSLPGEQAYETIKTKENIFTCISKIRDSIRSKPRGGELLVFGAGPLGKIIGSDFSKAGGVALDLGSLFDMFVGKRTRGAGKGPEAKMDVKL